MRHTFSICAYKNSPYLETCIRSLLAQTVLSDIIICTSTPNTFIYEIADKYNLEVFVHEASTGIGSDWNFAYEKASTPLVTIAHQDDIYLRQYTRTLLEMKGKYPDMSLFATSSVSLRKGKLQTFGRVEIVKKLLRLPLRLKSKADKPAVKLAALRLGNPIICPSCAYDKTLCGEDLFLSDFSFALDWSVLVKLAKMPGRFIVCEKPLIIYRIHEDSETMNAILDSRRRKEDEEMFRELLPKPLANIVKRLYRSSYDAYTK